MAALDRAFGFCQGAAVAGADWAEQQGIKQECSPHASDASSDSQSTPDTPQLTMLDLSTSACAAAEYVLRHCTQVSMLWDKHLAVASAYSVNVCMPMLHHLRQDSYAGTTCEPDSCARHLQQSALYTTPGCGGSTCG